jgi:hypothetical protein
MVTIIKVDTKIPSTSNSGGVTGAISGGNINAGNVLGAGAVNGNIIFRRYKTDTPKLTWTIEHNLNTNSFISNVYDSNGSKMHATTEIINKNTIKIFLTSALTGYVDIIFNVIPTTTYNII